VAVLVVLAVREEALVAVLVVLAVPVAVLVVRVAVLVRRVVVVHRVAVADVVVRKSCSPVRFATPSRQSRFPRASSSSNVACQLRSSRRA